MTYNVRRRLLLLVGVLAALVGVLVTVEAVKPSATTPDRRSPVSRARPTAPASGSLVTAAAATSPGGESRVTAGDSKANCVSPDFPGGVLSQSIIDRISAATGITYDCLNVYDNPMPAWGDWETPWMFRTASDGWDAWLAASRKHQVIMSQDLIPESVSQDNSDPLSWEQPCAGGDYDQYATALAQNLVAYGAGNLIIRLGIEANGYWEADYVGTTSTEMSDWSKCYDNEVTAMRAVPGADFLFVWNPNICTGDIPLNGWYPGNSYVNIIGPDDQDKDCGTLKSVAQEGWKAYSTDGSSGDAGNPDFPSLANIEAFAVAHGKPMSFPEWGLLTGDDDAAYVTGLAQMFNSEDFAYQCYFDNGDDGIASLGSSIPKATAAYAKDFR
jgi:hypothetical protein